MHLEYNRKRLFSFTARFNERFVGINGVQYLQRQSKEGGDMAISLFINLNGNRREAVLFYADAFRKPAPEFMTFADAPPDPDYKVNEKNAGLIMFTSLNIEGNNLMLSDIPEGWPHKVGNNIGITLVLKDMD